MVWTQRYQLFDRRNNELYQLKVDVGLYLNAVKNEHSTDNFEQFSCPPSPECKQKNKGVAETAPLT